MSNTGKLKREKDMKKDMKKVKNNIVSDAQKYFNYYKYYLAGSIYNGRQ